MKEIKSLNIYEYDNYRLYLRDLYAFLKATKPSFSYRYFARMAGFASPNFLQLIIEGKRNLSPESVDKFSKAFKLNREEASFFRTLVSLNQARTVEERTFHAEQLVRSRPYRKVNPLNEAQFQYYAKWYLVPLRELVALKGFKEDPEWIAHTLVPAISAAEAKKGLEVLQELGLIRRTEDGALVQSEGLISTGDEVKKALVGQFHREMIQKGMESIDRFPGTERQISSVTLGLSADGMKKVKELIVRFRKELMSVAGDDRAPTQVVQFNFQVFPLSKGP